MLTFDKFLQAEVTLTAQLAMLDLIERMEAAGVKIVSANSDSIVTQPSRGWARLPQITDARGAHWRQPKGLRDRVRIYETHATISETDWRELSHYESSYPSGAYAGKVWRRAHWLCWYGRPHMVTEHGRTYEACSIGYTRALIVGPGTNVTYRAPHK